MSLTTSVELQLLWRLQRRENQSDSISIGVGVFATVVVFAAPLSSPLKSEQSTLICDNHSWKKGTLWEFYTKND